MNNISLYVSGGRIEKKEEGRTIRNDQKQCSAKVFNEKKGKPSCTRVSDIRKLPQNHSHCKVDLYNQIYEFLCMSVEL